jgi:N-acetylneuraminic acid mutarotase
MRYALLLNLLFLGFIFINSSKSFSQGTWTQLPDFPGTARGQAVSFMIGSKAYVGTGRVSNPANLRDFWEFDGVSQVWTQKADYDTSCYSAAGFSIGTKGYIGTGSHDTFRLNFFWEYDQALNTWTRKADFPDKREKAVGFSVGNKGYIATGAANSYSNTLDLFEYNPANDTWTQKNNVGSNYLRSESTTFNINGTQYLGLGNSNLGNRNDFWKYNPVNDTWTQIANFAGSARRSATAFVIGSNAYVGLGYSSTANANADFYKYDPALNTWSSIPNFPAAGRGDPVAFSYGNKGYVMGGWYFGTNYKDFWVYDPNGCIVNSSFQTSDTSVFAGQSVTFTNTSTNATSYSWQVNGTQFSTLQSPTYLFSTPGSYTVSLIASGTCIDTFSVHISVMQVCWTGISSYLGGVRKDCFSFTAGGKGYVGGGTSNYFDYKNDMFEYDPVSASWTQKSNMSVGRRNAAAFSIGNSGFVGTGFNGSVLNDFWQWDQTTDTWTQRADFPGSPRSYAIAFSANGKGYMGNGTNLGSSLYYNDFYEFDPSSNTWTAKASYPGLSRYGGVGLSAGNKGYAALGIDGTNSLKEFYEYDPVNDTWTQKADFAGVAATFGTGFSIGSNVYLIVQATSFTSHFYKWDPLSNSWTQQQDFPGASRQSAVAFSIGNAAYYGTGEVTGLSYDMWKFDCAITNLPDLKNENITFSFQNPNNGTFLIEHAPQLSKSNFVVMDLTGKVLYREMLNGVSVSKINLPDIASGVYFYSVAERGAVLKSGKILIIQ